MRGIRDSGHAVDPQYVSDILAGRPTPPLGRNTGPEKWAQVVHVHDIVAISEMGGTDYVLDPSETWFRYAPTAITPFTRPIPS